MELSYAGALYFLNKRTDMLINYGIAGGIRLVIKVIASKNLVNIYFLLDYYKKWTKNLV